MNDEKSYKRVGTHHGKFHADEVMATAILKEIYDVEVIRTRDREELEKLDIVYDVGGGEFDHHDTEKEYREDGVPYAACGLIWRRFGGDVIKLKDPELSEEELESAVSYIDRVLIKGIDALDNGVKLNEGLFRVMSISTIIANFNPPWYMEKSEDEAFNEAVEFASTVLINTINTRFSVIRSRENVIRAYENRTIPEVIVLDTFCPWGEALRDIDKDDEVLYVIYPSKDNFASQTVRGKGGEDKKPFPLSWAGKRDEELAAVTGVKDSVFCHTGRFIAVAKTLEGVMKLTELAIREPWEKKRVGIFGLIKKLLSRR